MDQKYKQIKCTNPGCGKVFPDDDNGHYLCDTDIIYDESNGEMQTFKVILCDECFKKMRVLDEN